MDPLFRGRDRDHILRSVKRIRSSALRRRVNESNARKSSLIRLYLQQQMVRKHVNNFISKQKRLIPGQNKTESFKHMLHRVYGTE